MDNYPIKSVTFGGFDKQDVIRYIEQSAEQSAAAQKALQAENDALQKQNTVLTQEISSLRAQLKTMVSEQTQLQESLARETAQRQELEALKPLESELVKLRQEVDSLRPDAQSYAQFRERIGAIECEARERAAELENTAAAQLRETVNLFQEQYQALMHTFEATANHVTSELRKVEVNLTQLPRTMDKPGAELKALAARLEQAKNESPS